MSDGYDNGCPFCYVPLPKEVRAKVGQSPFGDVFLDWIPFEKSRHLDQWIRSHVCGKKDVGTR